ncbi:MAG: acyltransferase family protein [bacterium]
MGGVERSGSGRDPTLDVLRGLTIAAVTAYHFHADTRGLALPPDLPHAFLAAVRAHDPRGALGTVARICVAAPAYRLDLFLFVTGVVLARAPRRPTVELWKRRARDVLPNYWLGSVAVAAVLVVLAALRSALLGTPLGNEIHDGTRLARAPYVFDALDLARSLAVLGRFEDVRCFQVVAPSMWYVLLLLQAYLLFPALRALRDRVGAPAFLAAVLALTALGRWLVFRFDPLARFGPNPTVLYFIPFRLAPVALGMVASAGMGRAWRAPRRALAYAIALPALAWVAITFGLAARSNQPGTLAGVVGPVAPLALGIPALLWLALAARLTPGLGAGLGWAGQHSLSILVVQDALRLVVGTLVRFDVTLERWFWVLLVPYLGASALLARGWDPLAARFRDRIWPLPPRSPRASA